VASFIDKKDRILAITYRDPFLLVESNYLLCLTIIYLISIIGKIRILKGRYPHRDLTQAQSTYDFIFNENTMRISQ
jgi:hypothetical protein